MTRRRIRARKPDDGVSLALVMVFVIGVGLVTSALLTYSQTAFIANKKTAERQVASTDTAGALDHAINLLRYTNYADPSVVCPLGGPGVAQVLVPTPSGQMLVSCRGVAGTGIAGTIVPITDLNRPGSALLTLGTSGSEDGVSKGSNGILRIKGRVYVNSNVVVSGSACPGPNCSEIDVIDAPATAKTGCTAGRLVSISTTATVFPVTCSSTANPPEGKDPALLTDGDIPPDVSAGRPGGAEIATGYAQPPSAVTDLVHRVVPACPAGYVVYFEPGYYDNVKALNDLTGGGCSRTYVFKPGVYYFDFRDEEVTSLPVAERPFDPAASNVWNISDSGSYVIGGTLSSATLPTAAAPPNLPGACVSPLTTSVADRGVQFVFGGSSRMRVAGGNVELCGQYFVNKPPIVVYGAKTGATTVVGETPKTAAVAGALNSTAVTYTPAVGSSAVAELASSGGGMARAVVTRPNNGRNDPPFNTGTWRLSGFSPDIPAGSVLTQADVIVTHKESTTRSGDKYVVTVTPNPAGPEVGTPIVDDSSVSPGLSSFGPNTVDLLTTSFPDQVWANGLADARIDLAIQAITKQNTNTSLTADIDSVVVKLAWRPPSLRGQGVDVDGVNCLRVIGTGSCAVVSTQASGTALYFQGTTYVPLSALDMHLTNVSGQVFRAGLISRSLVFDITASAAFSGPVIEVANESTAGITMDAELVAYTCPVTIASGSCGGSTTAPGGSWVRAGRAKVSLTGAYPAPTNGRRGVKITSWQLN